MPVFTYKAKKSDGAPVTGTLQAESERAAVDVLFRQGVFPMEIRNRGENERAVVAGGEPKRRRRRATREDVAIFTRQLADLLRAGVALHRALLTLHRQTSNLGLSEVIDQIADDVRGGKPLFESMEKHPKIFSALHVNMIRAGETGGFLQDVLLRIAKFIEKDNELRARVRAALAYPILLLIIGAGSVGFLLTFFIPRFSTIFHDLGGNLPVTTQIVISVGDFMENYWILPFAALLFFILMFKRIGETRAGRQAIDRIRINIPFFGDVVRKNGIARFTRTLGTMLKSGVPILTALQISREAIGNSVLMSEIDEAAEGIRQGRSLGEMLGRSRRFPPMVVDMVSVGEESGNLADVLVNIAESYDVQVDRAVRVFISLFEPALLLVMAAIVGFIVISMLLPVFTLSSMIR